MPLGWFCCGYFVQRRKQEVDVIHEGNILMWAACSRLLLQSPLGPAKDQLWVNSGAKQLRLILKITRSAPPFLTGAEVQQTLSL